MSWLRLHYMLFPPVSIKMNKYVTRQIQGISIFVAIMNLNRGYLRQWKILNDYGLFCQDFISDSFCLIRILPIFIIY